MLIHSEQHTNSEIHSEIESLAYTQQAITNLTFIANRTVAKFEKSEASEQMGIAIKYLDMLCDPIIFEEGQDPHTCYTEHICEARNYMMSIRHNWHAASAQQVAMALAAAQRHVAVATCEFIIEMGEIEHMQKAMTGVDSDEDMLCASLESRTDQPKYGFTWRNFPIWNAKHSGLSNWSKK